MNTGWSAAPPQLSGNAEVVLRAYRGVPQKAFEMFAQEAAGFDERNYYVERITWIPGEWEAASALLATLLILLAIGILMIAYMLVTRPPGILLVTYRRGRR